MAPTARLPITDATVARQHEAHHYTGCDGYPAADVFDAVCVTTADGREWTLPNGVRCEQDPEDDWPAYGYRARYDAEEMLVRLRRRGSIDPALWLYLEPQPSLEERFAQYAQEEQMERMGYPR